MGGLLVKMRWRGWKVISHLKGSVMKREGRDAERFIIFHIISEERDSSTTNKWDDDARSGGTCMCRWCQVGMSVSDTCSPRASATAVPRARLAALNQISADGRTRVPPEAPVVYPYSTKQTHLYNEKKVTLRSDKTLRLSTAVTAWERNRKWHHRNSASGFDTHRELSKTYIIF